MDSRATCSGRTGAGASADYGSGLSSVADATCSGRSAGEQLTQGAGFVQGDEHGRTGRPGLSLGRQMPCGA